MYRDRRYLPYQNCPGIAFMDEDIRRRFTAPFPPSLFVTNAQTVRLLEKFTPTTTNNSYLFENLSGSLLESRSIDTLSTHSYESSPRNSRLTRSFQAKASRKRVTRLPKQQTCAANDHQQHAVLVENEVVFQQLLKECTTKVK